MRQEDQCKAFASRERVRLLACLERPKSVSELLSNCTLSQSALSQHLKVLRDAGLVVAERNGRRMLYSVASRKARVIARSLLELIRD